MRLTVYQVWSFEVEGNKRPRLHGTRQVWNDPTDVKAVRGAIQLQDRIRDRFYKKNTEAYVYIKEVRVYVPVRKLAIKKKPPLG